MKLRRVAGEPAELRRVDQLLQVAYQAPTRERELAILTTAQPDGLVAIVDRDQPVAVAAGSVRLIVPPESAHLDTLLQLGLRERSRLTHMRSGEPCLPGRRDMLVAQTSFAAG